MNQRKWVIVLRRFLIVTGTVLLIIHSSIYPETSFSQWINRWAGISLSCGFIVGGVEYWKKQRIAASILLGMGILSILDFVWLKFWLHRF